MTKITIITTLLIAASLLTSCTANKKVIKEKETLREQQRLKERVQLAERLQFTTQSHQFDSGWVTNDVVLEIIPIGKFTYSLSEGFQGEASKILVKGKNQQEYLKSLDTEEVKQEDRALSQLLDAESSRSVVNKSTDKSVKRSVVKLVIALLLGIGVVYGVRKIVR